MLYQNLKNQVSLQKWIGIILTALAVRIIVVFGFLHDLPRIFDAESYSREAARFFLSTSPYVFDWPPGMSFALAGMYSLAGASMLSEKILMILISLASVAMVWALAKKVAGERVAQCAGWIAVFYMPDVLMSGQPFSHQLAGLSLLVAAYCSLRAYEEKKFTFFFIAGVALGVGALARPSMLSVLIFLPFIFYKLLRKEKIFRGRWIFGGAIFFLAAAAVIIPVARHNASLGGGWTIATNNERNFFVGNNPFTPDYKTSHFAQRDPTQLDSATKNYLESFYQRTDTREAMMSEALMFIAHHPFITLVRTLNRIRAFWGFDYIMSRGIQLYLHLGNHGYLLPLGFEAGSYCVVMVLALIGITSFRTGVKYSGWLVGLVVAYQAPYMISFASGTYHPPVMWLLIPFAGVAITKLFFDANAVSNRRYALRKRATQVAIAIFILIQIEYAYFTMQLI